MKKLNNYQIATIFFVLTIAVYFLFTPKTYQYLNYFTPLANSLLHLKLDVPDNPNLNELVPHAGKFYVVYPPMPAVVLIPFVAIFGADFNQKWASIIIAAISVGLFFLLSTRFTKKRWISIFLTLLLGFGTNFYFTSLVGSSWYFAHVCAVFFTILAFIGATSKKPLLTGLFLGGAFLSRLPTIMIFPILIYLLMEESEKKERTRLLTNFLVAVLSAIIIFGLYNKLRFGSFTETGYSLIPGILEESWFSKGVFSVSYVWRNIRAAFASFPIISTHFPYLVPSNYAMAIYLSSPALVLVLYSKFKEGRVKFLLMSIILAAIPGFMHATVGFTQFGYRFSLDYIVLLILMLASSFERIGWRAALVLLSLSLAVNFYVIYLYQIGFFST